MAENTSTSDSNLLQHPNKETDELGITMVDVLQEEEELENDAAAVLGAGDDSSCTYNLGYMKRQPLYACITCCPPAGSTVGGICLGCSYHCHEGHELLELYTKRYFKCDCGTANFPSSNFCKLTKDKAANADNAYNQNFRGKYCICSRPYPDPEDNVEDSMIQCIICEDWYHGRHLKVDVLPSEEEYGQMICHLCVSKIPFIKHYLGFAVTSVPNEDTSKDIDLSSPKNGDVLEEKDSTKSQELSQPEEKADSVKVSESIADCKTSQGTCKLKTFKALSLPDGAVFLLDNWRNELCTCSSCSETYKSLSVPFLVDHEDTVSFYESEGRAKRRATTGVQREIDALSSLDRITRTEVVHEYNNLSTSLREYLRKFAENGKVVKDEDIREFFSELAANKRKKPNGMQYFCK